MKIEAKENGTKLEKSEAKLEEAEQSKKRLRSRAQSLEAEMENIVRRQESVRTKEVDKLKLSYQEITKQHHSTYMIF